MLDATQSQQAKVPIPVVPPARTNAPAEGSLGKARAREAQSALSCTGGAFLSAMPAETRDVAQTTLFLGLKEDMTQMHEASMHMLEFLQGEAQLAHANADSMAAFYEDDLNEYIKIAELESLGIMAEPSVPIRLDAVGFRMACSEWDKPELL